jgi:alkylhydroperoxidase family enzyme
MRLDYIPDDPQMSSKEDQDIVTRIKERRGGKLLELDKALLHAPAIANGWNGFLKAIRTENSLEESVREVAICRVAALNQAWYEWAAHAPILEKTGAVSKEAVENLKDRTRAGIGLDEKHLAVLEVTDASTLQIIVPQSKFDKLKKYFSDREIVEITATIAAYNCVSRFLVTLDVGEMAEKYKMDMS